MLNYLNAHVLGTIKKPPVDSIGWCYTQIKEDTSYR